MLRGDISYVATGHNVHVKCKNIVLQYELCMTLKLRDTMQIQRTPPVDNAPITQLYYHFNTMITVLWGARSVSWKITIIQVDRCQNNGLPEQYSAMLYINDIKQTKKP